MASSRLWEDTDVDCWMPVVIEPVAKESLELEGDNLSSSTLEATGKDCLRETLDISDVLERGDACISLSAAEFGEGLMCSARSISVGRSATPIIMLPTVPMIAEVAPVMGSHGPSSASYSRGRYLMSTLTAI